IPNAEGSRTTPSVVAFAKNGEVLVGEVAKRQAITNPDRTIRSVKRHMGDLKWGVDIDGKRYSPQEISARTLMKLKRDAESFLGGDDWDQVIIDWLVTSFKNDFGVDLSADKMAVQRLKESAEKAKIELSQVQQTQINLPFISATSDGPLHLDYSLTRAKFQEM